MNVSSTFRALRYKNYRLFFVGQSISLIGTWMTRVAMAWLVYRLTGSVWLLGVVEFAGQMATFLPAPLAGVLIDRWNRHRILLITQIIAMIQSVILAGLALTGLITVWQVIGMSIFQGLVNAFDIPVRQAFVVELVGEKKEEFGNAVALNASMFNGARLIGPSIAGMVIAVGGEGFCFLIDGISYLAVIATLVMMQVAPRKVSPSQKRMGQEMLQGVVYAWEIIPIRALLLFVAFVSFVGMPYVVLLPAFAKEILHGGPHTLGFLMGSTGLGALAGSIYLASRKSVRGLVRISALSAGLFGVSLIGCALARTLWVSVGWLFAAGFGMIVQIAACNTVLQTIVEDKMRGRVMSLFMMAFMGMAPWGSLAAASLAHYHGVPETLLIGGVACVLGAFIFASQLPRLRTAIRPIYARMGIIPEVASGIQTAAALTTPTEEG